MPINASSRVKQQIEKGISALKHGGIVAYPTDTVYGLGACFNCIQSVERIYRIKERPCDMALPLLLSDISQIKNVATRVPQVAWLLARQFMPGALTLVLHKSEAIPDIITGGGETIAIRVPAHPIPIALIEGVRVPIVGTSANRSGKPSALTADEVCSQLGDKLDLIIDGGKCPGGRESTVLDLTGETAVVLREGAISIEELKRVCSNIISKERI